ncbi:transcription elongation factor GreA [Candidatus Roizmanbacteria bacterium CG10_big_fil_rev_8_21_14_0_10_45_7]|uniref:Transcription elongation factor GreA n=1 Tax=Candidatus Roizmanbacteria bacterium CG10_big_fil_rev_8_21_14_0_10_45_7 TaxID=1974854 RepID=A0A2M8KUP8_9BACT|nr:MAG: transcription elongation factor GreA [Candidatus Roizmanbacteria bacterium CG10_big_fil_rev_8_21_14_0_10_45_7]
MKTQPAHIISPQGQAKLIKELADLRALRVPAVADLNQQRLMGDLKENSGYQAARARLTDIDARIVRIELTLRNCIVTEKIDNDLVQVGSVITVKNTHSEMILTIVGETEANPKELKVSVRSPLGKAFMDKKVGDTVIVCTPDGESTYTILKVS